MTSIGFVVTSPNFSRLTILTRTVLAPPVTVCLKTSRCVKTGHTGTCLTITLTCVIVVRHMAHSFEEYVLVNLHSVFAMDRVAFTFLTLLPSSQLLSSTALARTLERRLQPFETTRG